MTPRTIALAAGMVAALTGCATVPTGPAHPAIPGTGKTYDQFQADDLACRGYASHALAPSVQGANERAATSTAATTVIAAAAGALIGAASGNAGPGAAIGAGTGLLFGSATAGNAYGYYGQGQVQRGYDAYYSQCMYARGNRVPAHYASGAVPRLAAPPQVAQSQSLGAPPPAGTVPPPYPPPGTPPPRLASPPR